MKYQWMGGMVVALLLTGCLPEPVEGAKIILETITAGLEQAGIAKFKWPERLEFVVAMPLTPTRKIVRGELNVEHWLTFGCTAEMPLFAAGGTALLSKHPVETPVRMAPPKNLRLCGLLWPEAAMRMGDSAYVTRERVGRGQVILFAQEPDYRGTWHGTRRLFLNAVLLGPGCGTSQPTPN